MNLFRPHPVCFTVCIWYSKHFADTEEEEKEEEEKKKKDVI